TCHLIVRPAKRVRESSILTHRAIRVDVLPGFLCRFCVIPMPWLFGARSLLEAEPVSVSRQPPSGPGPTPLGGVRREPGIVISLALNDAKVHSESAVVRTEARRFLTLGDVAGHECGRGIPVRTAAKV